MVRLIKKGHPDWELLMQVLSGELPENDPVFVAWLNEDEDNGKLFESLKTGKDKDTRLFNTKKMYRNLERQLFDTPPYKRSFFPYLKYAAAVLAFVLLSFSAYYFINKQKAGNLVAQKEKVPSQRIEPGSKKALLVLADGSSVELDEKFQMKKGNGTTIDNDTTGVLTYNNKQPSQAEKIKPEYHTIKVPLGGEYELKLADGTHVFINSGSTLKFPSFFDGNERKVELIGEAYFDVTKNGTPFIVKTSNADIHVLGTSFNVSAYTEDDCVNATLVTGSILLKTASNDNGYPLHPGQNLNLEKASEQVKIQRVNTDIYTAWTRGEYVFRNQTMEDILNKLSKWYDFSMKFRNPEIRKMRFSGSVEKKRPLEYFLHQVEQVTNIKFKEYGNMIEIYQ